MSRVRPGGSGHRIELVGGIYRLRWYYEVKTGRIGRQRGHRRITRDTDRAGAERFAKKWGCAMPKETA